MPRGGKGKLLVDNAAGTPVDLTGFLDSVDWGDFSTETLDTTVFGVEHKTFEPSLSEGAVSATGKYSAVAAGPAATLRGLRGVGPLTVEWQPEGAGTGKPFRRVEAILTSYTESAPVGEIITWSASWQASGPETSGTLA
jgi:hypothetical protein